MKHFRQHNGLSSSPVEPTTIVEVTCVIPYRPTWWERLFFRQTQPTVIAPAGCIIWALVAEYRVIYEQPMVPSPTVFLKLVKTNQKGRE